MAVFTITGLTLKEAVRRKTLVGALLLGLLVLALSCILFAIKARLNYQTSVYVPNIRRGINPVRAWGEIYPAAQSIVTVLCLAAIKGLGGLFALMMAGGTISGEIERGVLAVILPKPIPRWKILLGKWIGLNIILVGSVLFWTVLAWASLTYQTGRDLTPILKAGLVSTLFPIVFMTVALTLSTFAQRVFGTSLAIALSALAWFDGILNGIAKLYDVEILRTIAKFSGLVVPQGYISWWVEDAASDIITATGPFGALGESPRFLLEWDLLKGISHPDVLYVGLYILVVFLLGVVIFHRRDV